MNSIFKILTKHIIFFNLGQYNIDVIHNSKHLKGSPFISYVFDASNVKIGDLPEKNSTVVHKPVSFKCKYEIKVFEIQQLINLFSYNQYFEKMLDWLILLLTALDQIMRMFQLI